MKPQSGRAALIPWWAVPEQQLTFNDVYYPAMLSDERDGQRFQEVLMIHSGTGDFTGLPASLVRLVVGRQYNALSNGARDNGR